MNILPKTNFEKIYTGSLLTAKYLQGLLENESIQTILRDDGESARMSGYATGYLNEAVLLVHKNDLIKGKHIVNSNLDENGDLSSINEDELSKQALASKEIPLQPSGNKKTSAYRRSPFNIFLNIAILLYSLWRLSPLLQGEQLPIWRIVLSGALALFCGWTVIAHFKSNRDN